MIKIEKIDMDGEGICYINNKITFVKKAVLDDILEIELTEEHRKYNVAKIKKLIKPSSERIEVDCEYYDMCGGCSYRHVNYEYESKAKAEKVKNLLKKFNVKEVSHIPAKHINHYRNKVVNPIEQTEKRMGMYMEETHTITPITECKIAPKCYSEIQEIINKWLNETNYTIRTDTDNGLIRNVMIRTNKQEDVMLVLIVSENKKLNIERLKEIKNLKEIYLNINDTKHNVILGSENKLIYQKEEFYDYLFNLKFKIYPNTFLQVNHEQTEILYKTIKEFLKPTKEDIILDCYCGIGTITLYLAGYVKEVVGIEIIKEAIDSANLNKELNKIQNASFIVGAVENEVSKLKKDFTKVVVDPPRKGLDEKVRQYLKESKFKEIVYVSCNPATLKRDLEDLKTKYEITKYYTIDLFPRTKHVETVVHLKKK